MKDNHFVFICPMFNASKTLTQLLHSIFGQSYENWRLILIDDMSSQEDREQTATIINRFRTISHTDCKRIKVIWNQRKKLEVENVLFGIKNYSDDNDIICRIDADDYLCELDALSIINEHYKKLDIDLLWTAQRWGMSDMNISTSMPANVDPYKYKWVTSHLKTFKRSLMNNIPDENFRRGENYINKAGDQALYLPLLNKTEKRFFLPRVIYHYNIKLEPETFQSSYALEQKDDCEFLRQRGYVQSGPSWDSMLKV